MITNKVKTFFKKGINITNDTKINVILGAALVAGLAYVVLRKTNVVSFQTTKKKLAFESDPDVIIERIALWIVNRSVDEQTTLKSLPSIRQTTSTYRSQILAVIQERQNKSISLGAFKNKLKAIGIQIATDMNIALKPKNPPEPKGRALGYFYDVVKNGNPPYGLGKLYHKVKANAAVSNYYHTYDY